MSQYKAHFPDLIPFLQFSSEPIPVCQCPSQSVSARTGQNIPGMLSLMTYTEGLSLA